MLPSLELQDKENIDQWSVGKAAQTLEFLMNSCKLLEVNSIIVYEYSLNRVVGYT